MSTCGEIALPVLESAEYVARTVLERYGMAVSMSHPYLLDTVLSSLSNIPSSLVRDSGVASIGFKDLGPSMEYYPNHGVYVSDTLFLNTTLVDDDQVFSDKSGRLLNRFDHTLYHEIGHGWDARNGMPSDSHQWLSLSGWSKDPSPGLCRVVIKEDGGPEKTGEWFFSPSAEFPRFYAKTNPWDDWADCFAFYVAGLHDFLPETKTRYFDSVLGHYWG